MTTLDVIVPVFNEQDCLPELFRRLLTLRAAVPWKVRLILVDDGSTDATPSMLAQFAQENDHVVAIFLSRNFGHQAAVTAGLDAADADWVAIIDADLQDPPELIEPMVRRAMDGFDVVYGLREHRRGETWFKRVSAALFYRALSEMCKVPIPRDTGDFRVLERAVVRSLVTLREQHRFIRGMVPWLGFRSTPFPYQRDARFAGETKYPFVKMVRFALDAIFSFSSYPLRFATLLGIAMSGVGALLGLLLVFLRLFTPYTVPGITAVIVTFVVMIGVQNIILGIMGEYLGRLFEEGKHRPLYVVQRTLGDSGQRRGEAQ